ncbi:hypothetical protein HDU82_001906 [Entophlyctis luteolus]|nr:hypothetical protein HDU82_001906 [Entophlyctis luteolus]
MSSPLPAPAPQAHGPLPHFTLRAEDRTASVPTIASATSLSDTNSAASWDATRIPQSHRASPAGPATLAQLQEEHAILASYFFKLTPQDATAASTSTAAMSNDSSAWTEQFLVFVPETTLLYAFTAPVLSSDVLPIGQIAVMRCTRMRDDHIGKGVAGLSELLLTVHGAHRKTWMLRAYDDVTAMSWMDAVNGICDGVYGFTGTIASRSASLDIPAGVALLHSKSHGAASATPTTNNATSGTMLQRVKSTNGHSRAHVAATNGPMAMAEREARMRKEHQEYILKQQQLCEKRKLEVRKEMEIFERGISSVAGLATPTGYNSQRSDEEGLRGEASKLHKFLF